METFDILTYLNGMAAAAYFLTCLVCGLQLCFDILGLKKPNNISRLTGTVLLCWSFSAVLYILSALVASLKFLYVIAISIDGLAFSGLAWEAHMLYSNRFPPKRKAILLASPYIIIVILRFFMPLSWCNRLPDIIMTILIIEYLHYGKNIRRHERELKDLYSDRDSHSLRWLRTVAVLYVVWLVINDVFLIGGLQPWRSMVLYTYMAGFVLFVFAKISKYKEPVSEETQIAIEQVDKGDMNVACSNEYKHLHDALLLLLENEKVYLNPNLTVDDVVRMLNTNVNYFYQMMRGNANTSFSKLINDYRVEHAKKLLKDTDYRVSVVANLSGFNSAAVFHRVFIKATGMTPSEWRKN